MKRKRGSTEDYLGNQSTTSVGSLQLAVTGSWLKTARLADEWHNDVTDPESIIRALKEGGAKADLFSFWQRLPDTEPKFPYYREPDPIAVMPITTYDDWLKKQINSKTRNMLTKAQKKGVVVRPTPFDDQFVRGMKQIFDEAPVRQGMRFWHYKKDVDTLKREFSRYLFREEIFGAYLDEELIGFIFLVNAGNVAMLGQIISVMRHRDKSPNNALIAKAVEICAERKTPYLAYAVWPRPGSLREFKRHNGFECVELPRYYVPLTTKGNLALKLGFHRDLADRLPEDLVTRLKSYRARFLEWRYREGSSSTGNASGRGAGVVENG